MPSQPIPPPETLIKETIEAFEKGADKVKVLTSGPLNYIITQHGDEFMVQAEHLHMSKERTKKLDGYFKNALGVFPTKEGKKFSS